MEEKHLVRAFVFGFDRTARLQVEQRVRVSGYRVRDIDPAWQAVRLHKRRSVHGVAPDIEGEAAIADDAGDDWSGVNAAPQVQRWQSHFVASRLYAGGRRLHF